MRSRSPAADRPGSRARTTPPPTRSTGRRESLAGFGRRGASRRQSVYDACSRLRADGPRSSGTTDSRRTISGIAMPPSRTSGRHGLPWHPSKLLLHADRNGFFYVLDRTTGRCCWPSPFCAASTGHRASPPTAVLSCRSARLPSDAANWSRPPIARDRAVRLLALEKCVGDKPGGLSRSERQRFLRASDIETGRFVSECRNPAPARAKTWSGVLATAGGLISTASRWRLRGRRSARRQTPVAVSDQRLDEGFADGVRHRRPGVHRRGRGAEHLCSAVSYGRNRAFAGAGTCDLDLASIP